MHILPVNQSINQSINKKQIYFPARKQMFLGYIYDVYSYLIINTISLLHRVWAILQYVQ